MTDSPTTCVYATLERDGAAARTVCWRPGLGRGWVDHGVYVVTGWVPKCTCVDEGQHCGRRVGGGESVSRIAAEQVGPVLHRLPYRAVVVLQALLTAPFASVHGEAGFSALPMPPPPDAKKTGGRLTGEDLRTYFQQFADRFLDGVVQYNTQVLKVQRKADSVRGWRVTVQHWSNENIGKIEDLFFDKLVLCTGVSRPYTSWTFNPHIS